jgi:YhcH/YjgK/YiaL family protein
MKRLTVLLTACLMVLIASAQVDARQWLKQGEWRSGFTKAKPHKTLNASEFQSQYQKNKKQWETLFQWLRDTDLETIPKGKHPIPGSTLVANVEDSENVPLKKRNTESHRRKIDFQLVVHGTEGFALLDHESSTISNPYDEKKDVMRYNYVHEKTHFFNVKGGQFVIFFPSDWHIAKIQTKKKNQQIRVIVVKMDYVE